MILLQGSPVAKAVKESLKPKVKALKEKFNEVPKLVVILVGNDAASEVYVGHKVKTCKEIGLESEIIRIAASDSPQKLYDHIDRLNNDQSVHGILVQFPLPDKFDPDKSVYYKVLSKLDPLKDVDCLTPENIGLAWSNRARVYPCTPQGVIAILDHYQIPIDRKHVVIVGRSEIVGKPMAEMFLERNATITICHSKTKGLEDYTKAADIVVAAIGKRNFFDRSYFTSDSVVIDVGIHRQADNSLCGDVYFNDVQAHVKAITPVPRGVGPMTIAMLMLNTVKLFEISKKETQEKRNLRS